MIDKISLKNSMDFPDIDFDFKEFINRENRVIELKYPEFNKIPLLLERFKIYNLENNFYIITGSSVNGIKELEFYIKFTDNKGDIYEHQVTIDCNLIVFESLTVNSKIIYVNSDPSPKSSIPFNLYSDDIINKIKSFIQLTYVNKYQYCTSNFKSLYSDEVLKLTTEFLKTCDFNISDIDYDRSSVIVEINGRKEELPISIQGNGFKRLLEVVPKMISSVINNGVYVINSLKESLHPLLYNHLKNFYNEFCKKYNSSSIIFTLNY